MVDLLSSVSSHASILFSQNNQRKMIVRKRPHSLLVDHEVVWLKNIAVKFRGGSALDGTKS